MPLSTRLRVIVSLCKSGSTALIHSLSHAPGVTCYLQTVKSGQRTTGRPDYGLFYQAHAGVAIAKETIGHSTPADCRLAVFPSDAAIVATRPLFLFRDPADTWSSWSRAGWGSLDSFTAAYAHLLDLHQRARRFGAASAIRFEAFGRDREAAFRRICRILEIPFTAEMLDWRLHFPDESPVIWRPDVQRDIEGGHADSVGRATGFVYRETAVPAPSREIDVVNRLFRARYEALQEP
ncbi:MAG: hypothetical protein RQ826_10990 [Xanthomonadales bacterium]|nr:hypothetical protein [Xanthomonadales bacterium]